VTVTEQDNTIVHIGTELRARREALELSPADIYEATHIRADYVEAIETLNIEALPSIGYVLGYVRTYAKFLGMNGDTAVARYKVDSEVPDNLGRRAIPHFVPKKKIKLPRGFVPALGVIGFVVMIGVWYGGNVSTVASDPAIATVNTIDADKTEETVFDPNMITLRANAPSWVQIKDAQGKTVISRIFVTGESYSAPKGSKLSISVRDAGAVDIYVGQTNAGPMGEAGTPIRDLPFPE
jgi:cytoskeletal protein RodZ